LSDTFAGIEPASVPAFMAAQLLGGVLAVGAVRVLYPDIAEQADEVVVPHPADEEETRNGAGTSPPETVARR
jgi:arsenate reductase